MAATDSQVFSERLDLPDGEAVVYRNVFSGEQRERLFQRLYSDIPWQQHRLTFFGQAMSAPRLSAWYGDSGARYRYSGAHLEPLAWTPVLLEIKASVETLAQTPFNSVLLNLYRDGSDSVGWHSDAEPELGKNPVIASVSLGAVRRFILQHKRERLRIALDLEPGSVLLMSGATQHHWRHQLPKTRQPVGPRINLTFRRIVAVASA